MKKDFFVKYCQQDNKGKFTKPSIEYFELREDALSRFYELVKIYNQPVITPIKISVGLGGSKIIPNSIIAEFAIYHY